MIRTFQRLAAAIRARRRLARTHFAEMRGFRIGLENRRPDISSEAVLQRLNEALGLLEVYAPSQIARMRRDVDRIWIMRYPCRGAYFPGTRTILTELTFLARHDISPAIVASSILHEAVHARLHSTDLRPHSRSPAREERICRRAELRFANALPPNLAGPVLARIEPMLLGRMDDLHVEVDWREARKRQDLADLEALGLPKPLQRLLMSARAPRG